MCLNSAGLFRISILRGCGQLSNPCLLVAEHKWQVPCLQKSPKPQRNEIKPWKTEAEPFIWGRPRRKWKIRMDGKPHITRVSPAKAGAKCSREDAKVQDTLTQGRSAAEPTKNHRGLLYRWELCHYSCWDSDVELELSHFHHRQWESPGLQCQPPFKPC